MASLKRVGYMKLSFIMTAYIVEFMALNGMCVGECFAIQPNNIDFVKKTLEIDGTIHWVDDGTGHGVKDTTKTEASYRTISLTTRSCDILRKVMLENKNLYSGNVCTKIEGLFLLIIMAILWLYHQLIAIYRLL